MNPSPLPDASGTVRGAVNLLAQSFAGIKTFLAGVILSAGLTINGVLAADTNFLSKWSANSPGGSSGSQLRFGHGGGTTGGAPYSILDVTNTDPTNGRYWGIGAGLINTRFFLSDDTTNFFFTRVSRALCDAGTAGSGTNTNLLGINVATGDVTAFGALNTNGANTWNKAQRGAVGTLTSSGGSIAIDLAANNNFAHTLTENTTLAAPSNATAGQAINITFTNHASSPKTLAFSSFWKFAGGVVPTLTATNGAVDLLTGFVNSAGFGTFSMVKDIK